MGDGASSRSSSRPGSGPYPGLEQLGQFIRAQRKMMELSQRELARLTELSDPYVSQLERGLHEPSVRVLKALSQALDVRAETMLSMAGLLEGDEPPTVVEAVHADPHLSEEQKSALLGVYRSFVADRQASQDPGDG